MKQAYVIALAVAAYSAIAAALVTRLASQFPF
jgi:hypothetical protein